MKPSILGAQCAAQVEHGLKNASMRLVTRDWQSLGFRSYTHRHTRTSGFERVHKVHEILALTTTPIEDHGLGTARHLPPGLM